MTVDFRPPEERGGPASPPVPLSPSAVAQRGRRLVQWVLGAASVVMVLAGVAVWLSAPGFFAPEVVPLVALVLVLAGVMDGVMAWGLGRWWASRDTA